MRLADIATSLVLGIFSGIVFWLAGTYIKNTLAMGAPWYQSTGIFPAIGAVALFLCSIKLFVEAKKSLGKNVSIFQTLKDFKPNWGKVRAAVLLFGWLAIYLFVMMPLLSFCPATFIFLAVLIIVSEKKFFVPVLAAGGVTLALYGIFGYLANLPLP